MIKQTTTMRFLLSAFIGITLSIQLQSCGDPNADPPCTDTQYETRNISADDLSKVPYTGFDTLYFLNKQGDTCIVRGTGKQFSYEIHDTGGNPDCPNPPTRYSDQVCSIQFVSLKGNLTFQLLQRRDSEMLYVKCAAINDIVFYIFSSYINQRRFPGDQYYIDSTEINGIRYERVALFNPSGIDTTYRLLYNQEKGVLYMKSSLENEEFSIIPKQ